LLFGLVEKPGGGDAVSPIVLAAVQSGVSDFKHALSEASFSGGHTIDSAQSEAGGHA
jgi:hypothetical protein